MKYQVGDNIRGRVILGLEREEKETAMNDWRVRFECCGTITTMKEASLMAVARKEGTGVILCRGCSKTANVAKRGKVAKAVVISAGPTWPVPPMLRGAKPKI